MTSAHSDTTVRIDCSAAFQLALFGKTQEVRDGAAEALWPRVHADQCRIECSDAPIESLPFSERVAALLAARAIEAKPRNARRLRAVPLYQFLTPPQTKWCERTLRVFRVRGAGNREGMVTAKGHRSRWSRDFAFTLPTHVDDTVLQVCGWGSREQWPYKDELRWSTDDGWLRINLSSCAFQRALRTYTEPRIVSRDGEELSRALYSVDTLFAERRVALDSGLMLRLASGALAGAVLSFDNEAPIVRGRRPRDITLSLEFGASVDEPVVCNFMKGDRSPRYELKNIAASAWVEVPVLGGDTVASLDEIARSAGVIHGPCVRGSFWHHPLHRRNLAKEAQAQAPAPVAEVA